MNYLEALTIVHREIVPANYVEIGCRHGYSLALAKCPSIAIDPDFEIRAQLLAPTRIFKMSSDDFFEKHDLKGLLERPVHLAFIDGMHQAAFALRDFMNIEQHGDRETVVVIDDVLPEKIEWATPVRITQAWTGDVYKLIPILRKYRPDLRMEVFDIEMKGMAIITQLNPGSGILRNSYADIERDLAAGLYEHSTVEAIREELNPQPPESLVRLMQGLAGLRDLSGLNASNLEHDGKKLYLHLLKACLLNEVYLDNELRLLYLQWCLGGTQDFDTATFHDIRRKLPEAYKNLLAQRGIGQFYERKIQNAGFAHSMMGRLRMDNLEHCLNTIGREAIAGDFIECGVWRGGGTIFMAGFASAQGWTERRIFVADSFEGLPKPSLPQDARLDLSKEVYPELAIELETVRENFSMYGLLNEQVVFLKGWFKDTLSDGRIGQLALLRLDGDLYESTMDALTQLYDKVAPGGFVIIDDFGIPNCEKAVRDFFSTRGEAMPPYERIDWTGVFWRKENGSQHSLGQPKMQQDGIRDFKTNFPAPFLEAYQKGVLNYRYKGVPCLKSPIDIAIYLQLLWAEKPRTIIEIGTKHGGSALFFSDIAKGMGLDCQIVSIDLNPDLAPNLAAENVRFLKGDVNHLAEVFERENLYQLARPWFVVEDSAHTYEGCLSALRFFAVSLRPGEMLCMEDGILTELGLEDKYAGGPNRAIREFIQECPEVYEVEKPYCDMFGTNATYNPNGYLRKKV